MPRSRRRALLAFDRAGQQGDRKRTQVGQRAVMLFGQNFGRCHQGGLFAGLDRAQHRQQRDQRLAGADIALEQTQHAAGGGQVGVDLDQSRDLGRRRRKAEAVQRDVAQPRIADQRLAGAGAHTTTNQREGDLAGEQLVIGQTGAQALFGFGLVQDFARPQGFGEWRPFLAFQQRRVVPLGKFGQQRQPLGQRGGDLTWPEPGGQAARPARSSGYGLAGRLEPDARDAAMVSRPLNTSSLPETSNFAPGGVCASRVNRKNTSSAVPVSSLTMMRQGWREFAGRSWRTTSTASVATMPGWAARIVGRALRSR